MEPVENEYTAEEIIESLLTYDGRPKKDAVEAALHMKDEITPLLIELLENVVADPIKYVEDDNLVGQIFAVLLLGHFKETKAHKVIIDLLCLPDEIINTILGDLLPLSLQVVLLNTCGGSIDLIKSLILNKEAADYCRISACSALNYAAAVNIVSREEVLAFFETLFTGDEADEASDFLGFAAGFICELCPTEKTMEVINRAYADGLIMPELIHPAEFDIAIKSGPEKCLEDIRDEIKLSELDDIHETMSWLLCYTGESSKGSSLYEDNAFMSAYPDTEPDRFQKKQKKAKKKKRKQSKASKKKNRR